MVQTGLTGRRVYPVVGPVLPWDSKAIGTPRWRPGGRINLNSPCVRLIWEKTYVS
jgi:hypothetical protein